MYIDGLWQTKSLVLLKSVHALINSDLQENKELERQDPWKRSNGCDRVIKLFFA